MHPYKRDQITPRKIPIRRGRSGIIEEQDLGYQNTTARLDNGSEAVGSISDQVAAPVDGTDWQATALRLQAEMDNFRKRQLRRAGEAIAVERERLLHLILPVADNLARALNHNDQGDEALRQGVELIYRELVRLLESEGVTRLETVGHPFDPSLHEAVATVLAQVEPDTIVEEIEAGYRLGGKLLRPARVVVAA